jgi:selenide,water dikinase
VDANVGWNGRAAAEEEERLLLADAQTSGGLLVCGEVPGAPIIGELRTRGEHTIEVR